MSLASSLPPPHRVVVLALDRVLPFDLGVAARVLGEAYDDEGVAPEVDVALALVPPAQAA